MDYHLPVDPDQAGMELDEFLSISFPRLSKGYLRRQLREGRVLVNGSPALHSRRLRAEQVVSVDIDEAVAEPAPVHIPSVELPVLFEDEHVIVVDKPANLVSEPDRWDEERPHLLASLASMASAGGDGFRPRLVHRLDKDTSGCVVVAKTIEAERSLREAFDSGQVEKTYLALVDGEFSESGGESEWKAIDFPIGPDRRKSGKMCVNETGKAALTHVRVEKRYRGLTLLCCRPRTGRTHQVRVHLSASGFPLAIDPVYGHRRELMLSELKAGYRRKPGRPEHPLMDRLTLHAASLSFPHVDGRRLVIESPVPRDFARVLKQLTKVRPLQ